MTSFHDMVIRDDQPLVTDQQIAAARRVLATQPDGDKLATMLGIAEQQ